MNEELTQLIDLQSIDMKIAGFDNKIAEKQQVIKAREDSIAEKEQNIAKCQERVQELTQQQRDSKAQHEDAGTRIKDRQNKMMQVQTSREHQALLKEIEENKKLLKETEEQQLQYLVQIEDAGKEAKELENLCKGEQELLEEENKKVDKEIKKIESSRKTVSNKRDKLANALNPGHLKRYNMLLKKREGLAVVQTVNGVCQGCFMTIPPQQFNEVRKGGKMSMCPTCQRILYYQEEEVKAVEK